MTGAGWLAARELRVRSGRAAVAVAVVAAAAALVSGIEVLSRLRERAVAADLDAIGPPIVLRHAGGEGAGLDARTEAAVADALGWALRRIERRLSLPREGSRAAVVGVEPGLLAGVPPGGATAGAGLAGRLRTGDELRAAGRPFVVAGLRPSAADADDYAVHVRLGELQAALGTGGASELRIFLEPGADPAAARRRLAAAAPGVLVSGIDRGEVAERGLQGSLEAHRRALYAFVALVAGLALLVAAHLDVAERRAELATLLAIGARGSTLLGAVVARSALVSLAGAVLGALLGTAVAWGLAPEAAALATLATLPAVAAAALAIGVAAALPAALAAAGRDPVPELQGWFG